jgi:hypothetical protein
MRKESQNTQFEIVEMATEMRLGRTFIDKLIPNHREGKNVVVDVDGEVLDDGDGLLRGRPLHAALRRILLL